MEILKSKNPKTISSYKTDAETNAETHKPLSVCAEKPSGVGDGSSPPFPFNVSEPTSFDSLEKCVSASSCSDFRPERLENDMVDTVRSGIERHSGVGDATQRTHELREPGDQWKLIVGWRVATRGDRTA